MPRCGLLLSALVTLMFLLLMLPLLLLLLLLLLAEGCVHWWLHRISCCCCCCIGSTVDLLQAGMNPLLLTLTVRSGMRRFVQGRVLLLFLLA